MSGRFGPEELLGCYRRGVFPMADGRDDPRLFIIEPDIRGIIPFDQFHVSRSLRKTVRRDIFNVRIDTAFSSVIDACAQPQKGRESTWINDPIMNLYSALHRMGNAHSVECWNDEGQLVGGLYGVSLGTAFFGESMFSRQTDASKVALVHLVARLKAGGYTLLDTQFLTSHLSGFGAIEVTRETFRQHLSTAMSGQASFHALGGPGHSLTGAEAVQLVTQTS